MRSLHFFDYLQKGESTNAFESRVLIDIWQALVLCCLCPFIFIANSLSAALDFLALLVSVLVAQQFTAECEDTSCVCS